MRTLMNAFSLSARILAVAVASLALAYGQTTSLGFSKNPALTGDTVMISGAVSQAGPAAVPAGTLVILKYLVNGIHASCSTPGGTFAKVALTTTGSLTYKANTSIPGSFGYQSRLYAASGNLSSPCADLVIMAQAVCPPGPQIAMTEVHGMTTVVPGQYVGGFKVTVQNCGTDVIPAVKIQGGTSGWTTLNSVAWTAGLPAPTLSPKPGGTVVISWEPGDLAPGARVDLTTDMTGVISPGTPNGTVLSLSGSWSLNPGGATANPVTLTVVNP